MSVNSLCDPDLDLLWFVTYVYTFYCMYICVRVRACVHVCVFWEREGGGGTPQIYRYKESYKDFNLKMFTSEWDSNPRTHEY